MTMLSAPVEARLVAVLVMVSGGCSPSAISVLEKSSPPQNSGRLLKHNEVSADAKRLRSTRSERLTVLSQPAALVATKEVSNAQSVVSLASVCMSSAVISSPHRVSGSAFSTMVSESEK